MLSALAVLALVAMLPLVPAPRRLREVLVAALPSPLAAVAVAAEMS